MSRHPTSLLALLALAGGCDDDASSAAVRFELPADATWTERSAPPPAAVGDLVLVTNNFDDTLSYVDLGLEPPAEIARIPVGLNPIEREGPHHLSFAPDHATVWVGISNFVPGSGSGPHGAHGAGTSDGYALLLRVADGAELGRVRVDPNPGDIRTTPDGRFVLLSHFDLLRITTATPGTPPEALASRLAIIDREQVERIAMVPTCPAAHGIVVSPDSRSVYLACWDDRMAVIDLGGDDHAVRLVDVLALPGTIAAPECQPYALTIAPDGGTVWVGCNVSGQLRAYDVARQAMDPTRVVNLGSSALFGTYLDADTLVVPSQGPDRLSWISAASGAVLHQLDLGASGGGADCFRPHAVAATSDGQRLAVVCEGDRVNPGTLVVIDRTTRTVTAVVPLGRFPDDIALRPAGASRP